MLNIVSGHSSEMRNNHDAVLTLFSVLPIRHTQSAPFVPVRRVFREEDACGCERPFERRVGRLLLRRAPSASPAP